MSTPMEEFAQATWESNMRGYNLETLAHWQVCLMQEFAAACGTAIIEATREHFERCPYRRIFPDCYTDIIRRARLVARDKLKGKA